MSEQKTTITISKPDCGWAHLHIQDERGVTFDSALSYVDDVLYITMRAFRVFLETGVQTAVTYDEEGSESILVLDETFTYGINLRDEDRVVVLYIDAEELIEGMLNEFTKNLKEWIAFCFCGDETPEEIECQTLEITGEIRNLYDLLYKRLERRKHAVHNV